MGRETRVHEVKYRRHNAKRDKVEPEIVAALEKAGWEVHRELPVDLLCLKRISPTLVAVRLLENKTPQGKKNPKAVIDKRQEKQNAFCAKWEIPKPTTPFEALLAVGEKVSL
jgi:hypothetical protein